MRYFSTMLSTKEGINHAMMKASSVIMLGLGMCSVSQAAVYEIAPTHANVRFAIDHFGTSTNTGGFYNLTGDVTYDPKAKQGSVAIDIPMDSLNTGNAEFDEHLKSGDFFDVEKYPTASFVSTQWHFAEDRATTNSFINLEDDGESEKAQGSALIAKSSTKLPVTHVDGLLTLHGKTHPITLEATKFNCYFSPVKLKQVCGGDFTTVIDRTKWGISKYVLMGMTKSVKLNIQIEATKR